MTKQNSSPDAGGIEARKITTGIADLPTPSTNAGPTEFSILATALNYAARGLPVFPCNPKNKAPLVSGGFHKATTDTDQIKAWFTEWPDAMIGMPTGLASGIDVLDLDRKNDKNGFEAIPDWKDRSPIIVLTPSDGAHLWFRSDGTIRNTTSDIAAGVDTRGSGGYVIVPPSQNGTAAAYRFEKGSEQELASLPLFPADLRAHLGVKAGITPGTEAQAAPELIAAALAVIPNADIGWEEWNNIGMAVWRATNGNGFEAFNSWSKKSKKYNAQETLRRWNHYFISPPTQIGAGSIFYMANEASPGWRYDYDAKLETAMAGANREPSSPFASEPGADGKPQLVIPGAEQISAKVEGPQAKTGAASTRNYELVRASDVIARAKKWLWEGHLLCGAQELLTGVPGLAKSQLQCSLVACATTGSKWPDGKINNVRVKVIMVTAEDTLDQEVVPRLMAAGADLNSIFFLKAIKKDNLLRMFLLSEDIKTLEQIIRDVGNVGLVTIDPITAFMGKIDSHQVAAVRSQLGPLKDLAERTEVGFSTITHPAKNAGPRAIDHFIGSQAFIAAGRIGHLCVEEVDDNDRPTGRILFTNPKNNPSPKMPTLAYRIEQTTIGQDPITREVIVAPRVVWDAMPVQMTADQAIAASTGGKKKEAQAMTNAVNFLRQELANGPRPVEEIKEAATKAGLSWSTVRRAQDKLKIDPEKGKDHWIWGLPEEEF